MEAILFDARSAKAQPALVRFDHARPQVVRSVADRRPALVAVYAPHPREAISRTVEEIRSQVRREAMAPELSQEQTGQRQLKMEPERRASRLQRLGERPQIIAQLRDLGRASTQEAIDVVRVVPTRTTRSDERDVADVEESAGRLGIRALLDAKESSGSIPDEVEQQDSRRRQALEQLPGKRPASNRDYYPVILGRTDVASEPIAHDDADAIDSSVPQRRTGSSCEHSVDLARHDLATRPDQFWQQRGVATLTCSDFEHGLSRPRSQGFYLTRHQPGVLA